MSADDLPLFQPGEVGLPATSWDDLKTDTRASRCYSCRRILRSQESIAAGIGPCCAARLGRAVTLARIRKARTPAA